MSAVNIGSELRVSEARLGPRAHVATITGEFDVLNTPALGERLRRLAEAPGSRLIADLTGVRLLDAAALGIVVGTAKLLQARGGEFVVVTDDPRLRRLFEAAGPAPSMHVERTLAEAVEHVVGDDLG